MAEKATYENEDKKSRVTNARRYWNTFSQRPYSTWKTIEEKLRPYFDKLKYNKYEKLLNMKMADMEPDMFTDNSRLDPLYLLGYHHFTQYIYDYEKNKEEN